MGSARRPRVQRMPWDTAVAIDPNARVVRDRLFANPVAIPGGLAHFFHDAGLVDVETQSLTIRLRKFRGLLAAVARRWQGLVGTYFANLAPDLNARIKGAVRDAYCSGSPRRAAVADGVGVGRMGKAP